MAIQFTGSVVFVDAPGTGIILPVGWVGSISAVVIVGGSAAGLLKIYADQAATAARQIFQGTAPINIAEYYSLNGNPGKYFTQNGFFVDLSGTGSIAFIYLA